MHAAAQLAADPDLARACLRDVPDDEAERALTVLARAWDLHEEAGPVISAALRDNLPGLAIPAAAVALQTSGRIGEALAAALEDAPAPLDTLISIEQALPYPSVALANPTPPRPRAFSENSRRNPIRGLLRNGLTWRKAGCTRPGGPGMRCG